MYCIFIPQREKYIKNFFNDYGLKINFVPAVYKDDINIEQMIKDNKLFKVEPFHSYHKSQMNDAEWAPSK